MHHDPGSEPLLKDCAWCGLPMEARYYWQVQLYELSEQGEVGPPVDEATEMVQTACLGGHYYGGPLADVMVGLD